MTTLLMHEQSYERVKARMAGFPEDLDVLLLRVDGSLRPAAGHRDATQMKPDIAWFSIDLLRTGQVKPFVALVLASDGIRWMQTFNAGLDAPYYKEIYEKGIRITKSDAQAVAIAEYVVGNVLALYQGIFKRQKHQAAHQWQRTTFREMWRTSWMIIGFGNIGREIAARIRGFGCGVIAVRQTAEDHPLADSVITLKQVPEYLPQADVVVLACALNRETMGLADQSFFSGMKEGSFFVNIARGKLVDQQALIDSLRAGRPAFAILDVFDPEPLPSDSPLWDMNNVMVTPHASNAGSGLVARGDELFLNNLRRYLAGEKLYDEVDARQIG